jgi:hypothetical protein
MLKDLFNLVAQKSIQRVKEGWTRAYPTKKEIRAFYHSEEWEKARYKQLYIIHLIIIVSSNR